MRLLVCKDERPIAASQPSCRAGDNRQRSDTSWFRSKEYLPEASTMDTSQR